MVFKHITPIYTKFTLGQICYWIPENTNIHWPIANRKQVWLALLEQSSFSGMVETDILDIVKVSELNPQMVVTVMCLVWIAQVIVEVEIVSEGVRHLLAEVFLRVVICIDGVRGHGFQEVFGEGGEVFTEFEHSISEFFFDQLFRVFALDEPDEVNFGVSSCGDMVALDVWVYFEVNCEKVFRS